MKEVIPISKHIYKAVPIKQLNVDRIIQSLEGQKRVVFGCDAAKVKWRGALMAGGQVVRTISWDMSESRQILTMLGAISEAGVEVEVAAEPTRTYADAFAYQCEGTDVNLDDAENLLSGACDSGVGVMCENLRRLQEVPNARPLLFVRTAEDA